MSIKEKQIKKEIFLASQRLAAFCKQLEKMSDIEKKFCIERTEQIVPELIPMLYGVLNEYME